MKREAENARRLKISVINNRESRRENVSENCEMMKMSKEAANLWNSYRREEKKKTRAVWKANANKYGIASWRRNWKSAAAKKVKGAKKKAGSAGAGEEGGVNKRREEKWRQKGCMKKMKHRRHWRKLRRKQMKRSKCDGCMLAGRRKRETYYSRGSWNIWRRSCLTHWREAMKIPQNILIWRNTEETRREESMKRNRETILQL